ncbi:hypothetical protein [Haliscomenobacter sp.]|uniref:hypothetical protein n=1 Tax=Haliscomenobacter sp. TaxID=2717303 RepID=UPI003364E92E
MQAVRTIQKSENGLLMIQLPEHFHDIDLEIIILPAHPIQDTEVVPPSSNRLEMVAHLKGILPDLPYSKYDFYEQ